MPSVPAILLILIPAVLMTVSIVREKELGSIINFYVTPTGRLEFLLGKQLPYLVIGLINFLILVTLALIVFGVPIKGSFLFLTLTTFLYIIVTTRRFSPFNHQSSSQECCSRFQHWKAVRALWVRSGPRLTTCIRAWAPTRKDSDSISCCRTWFICSAASPCSCS